MSDEPCVQRTLEPKENSEPISTLDEQVYISKTLVIANGAVEDSRRCVRSVSIKPLNNRVPQSKSQRVRH